jgi:flagellar biosynthesis chaperone FliJ
MTREQKDKILKALAEDRNEYARECQERIERECGKIEGADYMLQRFLDVLSTEVEQQESEDQA